MKCPHCQGHILDNAAKLKNRRHENGQCVDCAAPLTEKELGAGNWRCFLCRQRRVELRRRRMKVAA